MIKSLAAVLCLSAFALAPAASAQINVQATGRIAKLTSPPSCSPTATHRIDCTDIYLRAGSSVDLAPFEGKVADLTASLVVALCSTLEVTAITSAPYSLTITPYQGGSFRIGERVTFRQTAPLLSLVPLVMAPQPGFLPVSTYGTYQLDLLSTVYFQNYIALLGFVQNVFTIPNDTAYIGLPILSQGIYASLLSSPPTVKLLNAACFTIQAKS